MAPNSNTVDSYWRMIWQNNVSLIVQLCPEEEGGKVIIILIGITL